MAHHSIEEVFRAIRPKGVQFPADSTISAGVAAGSGDLGSALSQAGQQIAQLQAAFQQQAALIQSNTLALQSNTSAKSGGSLSSLGSGIGSGLLGGGLGLLSPLISGIASLFGGGAKTPAPLPVYIPPPSVALSATLQGNDIRPTASSSAPPSGGSAPSASAQATVAPQITVNVHAMDSQSFMDRSSDIANAVREAMLNLHPINSVVAEL